MGAVAAGSARRAPFAVRVARAIRLHGVLALLLAAGALPVEGDSLLASRAGLLVRRPQRQDTTVRQANEPRHRGVAGLRPELTIGVAEGPPEYTFATISNVAVTSDGSVLVLEAPSPGTPSLRQYDASGHFIRRIGGRGEGPGEYRGPGGIAVLPDGRILLADGPAHRINVYSPAGEPVDTWVLSVPVSTGGNGGLRVESSGSVVLRTSLFDRNAPPAQRVRQVLLRLRSDGTVLDTLSLTDMPEVRSSAVTKVNETGSGTSTMTLSVPYSPRAVWAWSPLGYMVTGITGRYAVDLRLPANGGAWRAGDPVRSLRRSIAPVPVGRDERAAQRKRIEEQLSRAPGRQTGSLADIPETKTPWKDVRIADDGRIWVTLSTPSEKFDPQLDPGSSTAPPSIGVGVSRGGAPAGAPPGFQPLPWREPQLYDVLDPDGTWLGQVAVPFDTRLISMNGDVVWGVVRDKDDVPVLKRFRIDWH